MFNISVSIPSAPQLDIPQSICSPVPLFLSPDVSLKCFQSLSSPKMFPKPYVPQSRCSPKVFPVPMFPKDIPQSLCSPVLMLPVPVSLIPVHQSLCSPVLQCILGCNDHYSYRRYMSNSPPNGYHPKFKSDPLQP